MHICFNELTSLTTDIVSIGVSYVTLCCCDFSWLLSIKTLASLNIPLAVAPICSSISKIFSTVLGIINLSTILLSAINSTPSVHTIPIAVLPCFTVFFAYSTCNSLPSGENIVMALS